MNSGKSSV